MKVICFILSLYVILLSTIPCCFDNEVKDDVKIAQDLGKSPVSEDCNADICSPFFSCAACSGVIFILSNFDVKSYPDLRGSKLLFYKTPYFDHFFVKIWQPPQNV
jgi:hypothetical protein